MGRWRATLAATIWAGLAAGSAQAGAPISGFSVDVKVERRDRTVDRAAIASQDLAIGRLVPLLNKYRGTSQEPVLLAKLAELQHQKSAILFRIAHSGAQGSGRALDLAAYRGALTSAITTLDRLLSKYPRYGEIAHAIFIRGKCHEDLDQKAPAKHDYLDLVTRYPEADEAIPATMALAELSIQEGDHAKAIPYLARVEAVVESPYHPFALYKLAWAHHNLKAADLALGYVRKHVSYFDARCDVCSAADRAFRENMLLDSTVFYLDGFEQDPSKYSTAEALPFFERLESGPALGRMLVRFSKLLRSHGHEANLIAYKTAVIERWKNQPLAGPAHPGAVDADVEVALVAYEMQLNRRRFDEVVRTSQDLVELYGRKPAAESMGQARKLLTDTAATMQEIVLKNKGAEGVRDLSTKLAAIYDTFTKIVPERDPRVPRVHYNLAETLFEIGQFEEATRHYRWVVERGALRKLAPGTKPETGGANDASLKAIASRYEELRARKLIPTKLEANPGDKPEIDPSLAEWVAWIDHHVQATGEVAENFQFEAARALYFAGAISESTERLDKLASKLPASRFATGAAQLVLDTLVAGALWEETLALSEKYLALEGWPEKDFKDRLHRISADSAYKLIERDHRERRFKSVMARTDRFLEKHPGSPKRVDCLALAGASALETFDRDRAAGYFTLLIGIPGAGASVGQALIARASLLEDRYELGAAACDYRAYLSLSPELRTARPKGEEPALRRKTLALAQLSGDAALIAEAIPSTALCGSPGLETECDLQQALSAVTLAFGSTAGKQLARGQRDRAVERAKKGPEPNRAAWAVAALAVESPNDRLEYRERLSMIRQVSSQWEELDPISRMTLLPTVSAAIARAFGQCRTELAKLSPLRASARSIAYRVDALRELESVAVRAAKLPWARIRVGVLNELANAYLDLARGLQALAAPKGLPEPELQAYEEAVRSIVIPFEKKGQDIRSRAFEIASSSAIEDASIDLRLLEKLDPTFDWEDADPNAEDPAERLVARWRDSISARRWAQVAFYLQEASEKALVPSGTLGLLTAVSLAQAGARAEAVARLLEARSDLKAGSDLWKRGGK